MKTASRKKIMGTPASMLSRQLHQFMKKENVHEAELARETAIPQPTLHKLLTGKTTDPRLSTLQTLADYFRTSIDALYTESNLHNQSHLPKGKAIPIISWEDALDFRHAIKHATSQHSLTWIVVEDQPRANLFALKSKASMEPYFPRNTILIVDTDLTPSDGDLMIVHFPNTPACTI